MCNSISDKVHLIQLDQSDQISLLSAAAASYSLMRNESMSAESNARPMTIHPRSKRVIDLFGSTTKNLIGLKSVCVYMRDSS